MYIDNLLTYSYRKPSTHTDRASRCGQVFTYQRVSVSEWRGPEENQCLGLQGVYSNNHIVVYRVCIKNKFISWTTGCVLIQNHFMEYRVCIKTKAWVRVY